ncbi:MAG: nitroreductase [Candidatus Latescibacteria bacterium]|nr:nitroreductase [bacterium]MBD3424396.1 nitroreductase [Candidatus Latescibacterota bacterium]
MDLYKAIEGRVSTRKYRPDQVPEELLEKLLEAARLAPSGKNGQPWRFIVVTENETRKKLMAACKGQKFIYEAPVVIVACGYEEYAYKKMGGYWNSLPVDIGISLEHLILAAEAEGLGTCWIGAFLEEEVREILSVPDEVKIVAITPLGYPEGKKVHTSRKKLEEIVMHEKWQKR